jgi:hypothetical protein
VAFGSGLIVAQGKFFCTFKWLKFIGLKFS